MRNRDFDSNFNSMKRLVIGFIVAVFVVIVIGWGSCAFIIGSVVTNPEGTGKAVGEFTKDIHDGYKEATKPE